MFISFPTPEACSNVAQGASLGKRIILREPSTGGPASWRFNQKSENHQSKIFVMVRSLHETPSRVSVDRPGCPRCRGLVAAAVGLADFEVCACHSADDCDQIPTRGAAAGLRYRSEPGPCRLRKV